MSRDPIRWRDDPGAPAELANDLAAASASHVAFDTEGGLTAFRAVLAAAGGAAVTGTATAAAAGGHAGATTTAAATVSSAPGPLVGGAVAVAKGGGLLAGHAAWLAVAAGAVVATAVAISAPRWHAPALAPVTAAATSRGEHATEGPDRGPDRARSAAAPTDEAAAIVAPLVSLDGLPESAARVPVVASPGRKPAAAPASTFATPDLVREETDRLVMLRAVAERDPARAVALADADDAHFRGGVFAQERRAIAIFSLVRSGRSAEAQRRARTFLTRYPDGPFTEKVARVTGAAP